MLSSQKPFRGVQLNRTHPLAKGLVGCWLFNEMTGETVFDLSGNGNTGALENGVAWSSSKFGGGLKFDGVDDYVETSLSDIGTGNDPFTISLWVNQYFEDATGWDRIISKSDNADACEFAITQDSTNNNAIRIYTYSDADYKYAITPNITSGVWHHITGVFDGSYLKIYKNGVLQDTSVQIYTFNREPSKAIRFGTVTPTQELTCFNGSIDSVNIYNRALSAEEIAWLYREPYAMFEPAFSLGALYAAIPPALKPMWYYNMLKRRNR